MFRYFFKKKKLKFNVIFRNLLKFTLKHSLRIKNDDNSLDFHNKKSLKNKRKFLYAIIKKKFLKIIITVNADTRPRANFDALNAYSINFLKKEKIYTKLKYSRVPQYDIASGASAALFAGFLGFLICEKFGFELLDSGDFYFLFMYIVFFFFFIRLLIKTTNYSITPANFYRIFLFIDFIRLLFI